jgi:hypothetical protein
MKKNKKNGMRNNVQKKKIWEVLINIHNFIDLETKEDKEVETLLEIKKEIF